MISLKNVNKYFFKGRPNEIHVIDDITLELPATGMHALYGQSGCGKTTLLNTIGGLDGIKSGSIEIDGNDIKKNTDNIRNRYIGYIFQNYNLNLKVSNYENVAESLRLCGMEDEEEISKRVMAALENVGMEKYIHRMPDTLSGGQKQRIAIARAIVKNPAIILADEPTGNLDESNTIVIMDLLKSISKEHLVLLVTHESELVDHYCEQVIELKDGHIENVRKNAHADGYVARDKNTVYLGEMEKRAAAAGRVTLNCYGDEFPENVTISLVNRNGQLLLKCDNAKVKLLDDSSEITFSEKTFKQEEQKEKQSAKIDMSCLPAFEGKNYGRLFHIKNAAKESYGQLKEKKSRGNKTLRRGLTFFTIIIVMLTAIAGKEIKKLLDARDSYNHNAYYVFAETKEDLKKLFDAADAKENGIDCVALLDDGSGYATKGDKSFHLVVDLFESFSYQNRNIYSALMGDMEAVSGHGILLSADLTKDMELVCGKKTDLLSEEVVISSELADIFLENSGMNFIKERSDLLGITLSDGMSPVKIVGIVQSDEPAVYVNNGELHRGLENAEGITYSEEISVRLSAGEAVYNYYGDEKDAEYSEGETVKIGSTELKIKEVNCLGTKEEYQAAKRILEDYDLERWSDKIKSVTYDSVSNSYEVEIKIADYATTTQVFPANEYESIMEFLRSSSIGLVVSENDYDRMMLDNAIDRGNRYVMVHASDNSACEAFLRANFEGRPLPAGVAYSLYTPDDIYKSKTSEITEGLSGRATIIFVFCVLLCICMYMIMRGSVMSRVKEIGVYRCIGVTKKNMNFRFMVECFVLATMSILPGVLFMVGSIHIMTHLSGIMFAIFMPWWLCVPVLIILYIIAIVCGVLPCIMLMRKTPAQIMAKYDV
ncbi:MAG: ABC transporter ATP-binding protein/permease [Lachnospiraceae bacterium]|nr:ABC transporter ATP-binding protein/permease [Lachnospiraceae bacterium]